MQTIVDAEKEFMLAAEHLHDQPGLWRLNRGLLNLCDVVKKLDERLAALDVRISRASRQGGGR